jgi:hypothetical protein
MRCPLCQKDLGSEPTIFSIKGTLYCRRCARRTLSALTLLTFAEEIVPSDISLSPECEWCGKDRDTYKTRLGILCEACMKELEVRPNDDAGTVTRKDS